MLREHYADTKHYMSMLSLQSRRRILDEVFEEVKYDKGHRPNCHRDEKNYWLLGVVPNRGNGRAGTGAMKYASGSGNANCMKHLCLICNAYLCCYIDERTAAGDEKWANWGFCSYVVNYNWGCEVHVDRGNKGMSYGEGFGEYEGGDLLVYEDPAVTSMYTEVDYYYDSLCKLGENNELLRDEHGNTVHRVSAAGRKLV